MIEFLFKKYYDKLSKKQKKIAKILFFLINLHIFGLPLYFFNKYNPQLLPIQSFLAKLISLILSTNSQGPYVFYNNYIFEISADCIGIKSSLAWFSLTFSIPFLDPKRRFVLFVKYIPLILSFNFLRILVTIYFSKYVNPFFLHNFLWTIILNFFLFGLFFYVIKNLKIK